MNTDLIDRILNRGTEEIIDQKHLEETLRSGKKLRVKLGIDPTAPDIHLGHSVVLRKLKQFQELGHTVVLIIGDFTARIGDPSGRNEARKPLTAEEIEKNLKGYLEEAGKIINVKKSEIRRNSEWHAKGGLEHILSIAQSATIQQILRRDDFKKRLAEDSDISLLETLYPILQGYDSVAVKADVELGGTDQKFNLLMGRRVQRHFGMNEQDILTVPLIEGTDGVKKMSKSYGNYIGLSETPENMFGKTMAIPDALIKKYFTLLTDNDIPDITNPYEAKMLLAETITGMYHSKKDAEKARENFIKKFSKKETPDDAPALKVGKKETTLLDLLLKSGVESKSEARRLITQHAIQLNETVKKDPDEIISVRGGEILKVGKRKFFKLV